jgi:hypothetical protein
LRSALREWRGTRGQRDDRCEPASSEQQVEAATMPRIDFATPAQAPAPDAGLLEARLLSLRSIDPATGCWEWQGRRDRWGYGRITVRHRRYSVHRLAASLFLGFELSSELHVLHRCDNPCCFRPDHLFLGTHADNMRDRQTKQREQHQSIRPSTTTQIGVSDLTRRCCSGD